VANDVTQATKKRIGGNQHDETLSARIAVRNSPVFRLSQQFLSDQARISMTKGRRALLMPLWKHLSMIETLSDPKTQAQNKASIKPNSAEQARIR
jgi:hypothetical protein